MEYDHGAFYQGQDSWTKLRISRENLVTILGFSTMDELEAHLFSPLVRHLFTEYGSDFVIPCLFHQQHHDLYAHHDFNSVMGTCMWILSHPDLEVSTVWLRSTELIPSWLKKVTGWGPLHHAARFVLLWAMSMTGGSGAELFAGDVEELQIVLWQGYEVLAYLQEMWRCSFLPPPELVGCLYLESDFQGHRIMSEVTADFDICRAFEKSCTMVDEEPEGEKEAVVAQDAADQDEDENDRGETPMDLDSDSELCGGIIKASHMMVSEEVDPPKVSEAADRGSCVVNQASR